MTLLSHEAIYWIVSIALVVAWSFGITLWARRGS